MAKDIMNTQDLSDIRNMLNGTTVSTDEYDLDSILAEVSGKPKETKVETPPVVASPKNVTKEEVEQLAQKLRKQEPILSRTEEKGHELDDIDILSIDAIRRKKELETKAKMEEAARKLKEDDFDEKDERRNKKQQRKARRKQEKKMLREEKRANKYYYDDEDDEDEYEIRDPRVASISSGRRSKSLFGRSIVVLILTVIATYISLAGTKGWPTSPSTDINTNMVTAVLVILGLQLGSMLIGIDVVGGGIYELLTGMPDRKTLVSCAVLSSFTHGVVISLKPEWGSSLPYSAISMLLLYAMMREEQGKFEGRKCAFKVAVMTETPVGAYVKKTSKRGPKIVAKSRLEKLDSFLVEMEKPDTISRFSAVYVPLMMAVSIIFALLVSVAQGVPSRFFWAVSVMFIMSSSLGVVCASGCAYKHASKRLLLEGAAISSARNANALRRARKAEVGDKDLFPAGSITIDEVRNYGLYKDDKVFAYAAAVTSGQELELGRVFHESLREVYGIPVKATNITRYESGGLSGQVGADSVLIGTAAFLNKLRIRIKDIKGMENGVFVVVNNQVIAAFLLTYHPSATSYSMLQALKKLKKKTLLATCDFNITPAMVTSLFEVKTSSVETIMDNEELVNLHSRKQDITCAILSRDDGTAFVQVLNSAERFSWAVGYNLFIGVLSGLAGVFLAFYLTKISAFSALEIENIFIYLILWYVPVWLITWSTTRKI